MGFSAVQDPQAVKQYTMDWSDWLGDGETITAATVTAEAGITVDTSNNDTTSVTFKLSAGVLGSRPKVTCHITTSAGQQDDRTLTVYVRNR